MGRGKRVERVVGKARGGEKTLGKRMKRRKGGSEHEQDLAERKMHSDPLTTGKQSNETRKSSEFQRRLHRSWPLPYLLLLGDTQAREIDK